MNIILLGIQGSGKGTQAEIMARHYNLAIFEMGNEFRHLAEQDTPLGKKIKNIIEHGKLVPAKIVIEVVQTFLDKIPAKQSVIFDGVPRNREQQKAFNQLLKQKNRHYRVVNINIPEDETLKRLMIRHRHDDTPEIIRNRITIFYKNTQPVIENYRRKKLVIDINGDQSIDKVAKEIDGHLHQYFHNHH